jgi:hypothetical protein
MRKGTFSETLPEETAFVPVDYFALFCTAARTENVLGQYTWLRFSGPALSY